LAHTCRMASGGPDRHAGEDGPAAERRRHLIAPQRSLAALPDREVQTVHRVGHQVGLGE
jgi:hypothetical protein